MTRRPRRVLALASVALLLTLLATCAPWSAWLLYNASASAPRGWYLRRPVQEPRTGALVLAHLPPAIASFAERRGYLPSSVPLLKRVSAIAPQHICVRDGAVRVDARIVGHVRTRDGAGRPLTAWPGCRKLRPGEVFLLTACSAASFDGRYFGPMPRSAVFGEAVPLWTW